MYFFLNRNSAVLRGIPLQGLPPYDSSNVWKTFYFRVPRRRPDVLRDDFRAGIPLPPPNHLFGPRDFRVFHTLLQIQLHVPQEIVRNPIGFHSIFPDFKQQRSLLIELFSEISRRISVV